MILQVAKLDPVSTPAGMPIAVEYDILLFVKK